VPASQAVLDFFPLGPTADNKVHGLLVAAVAQPIEQIITTLGEVKVRVSAVDLTAFGLVRTTAPLVDPQETVATVFIGDHTTQVVVARGGVPQFVRLLPLDLPTAAVQRSVAQAEAAAEFGSGALDDPMSTDQSAETPPFGQPLVSAGITPLTGPGTGTGLGAGTGTGSGGDGYRSVAAPSRMRRRLDEDPVIDLVTRLRSTVQFYRNRPGSVPVDRIFVTGAGAGVKRPNVMATLEAGLEAPVTLITAADVIPFKGPAPQGETALNLVSTIGIALGEVR
jgi:type IV pilus assembly protein PilM